MEEMTNGSCLLVSQQIAIMCFELAHYDHDVEFLLPDIHQKLKVGISFVWLFLFQDGGTLLN